MTDILTHLNDNQRAMMEDFKGTAKRFVETTPQAAPVALVFNSVTGNRQIIGMEFDSPRDKEICALQIQLVAKMIDADTIIFVSEAWLAKPMSAEDYVERMTKYGAVAKMPDRIDSLVVQIETHAGALMWQAEIKTAQSGKRKLAPWVLNGGEDNKDPTSVTGRFVGLLPTKGAAAPSP